MIDRNSARINEECAAATRRALNLMGTQKKIGKVLDVAQQTVGGWISVTGRIPFKYLPEVSMATEISPAQLRPDYEDILLDSPVLKS